MRLFRGRGLLNLIEPYYPVLGQGRPAVVTRRNHGHNVHSESMHARSRHLFRWNGHRPLFNGIKVPWLM